jgi:hypothetical protein
MDLLWDPIPPPQASKGIRKAFLECARTPMGHTLRYAERMNLAAMNPNDNSCSAKYCLANPGREYLIYLPKEVSNRWYLRGWYQSWQDRSHRTVTLDLSAISGEVILEWFSPATGQTENGRINGGDRRRPQRVALEQFDD